MKEASSRVHHSNLTGGSGVLAMEEEFARLNAFKVAVREAQALEDEATKATNEASRALMEDPEDEAKLTAFNDAVKEFERLTKNRRTAQEDLSNQETHIQDLLKEQAKKAEDEKADELRQLQETHAAEKRRLTRQSVAPQAPGAAAPTTPMVQGGQINLIPSFSGEPGYDVEGWIDLVERAQIQFNWNDGQLAAIVKNKLTGNASVWLRAQEKLTLPGFQTWIGHPQGLKHQLESKYLPPKTEQAAILAVMDLNQKPSESVSDFFDRVVLAVDKVNHKTEAVEKASAGYRRMFKHQVSTFFSAGLKQEIRQVVLGSNSAPETMEALRDQAVTTELQLNNKITKVKELVAVEKQAEPEAKTPTSDEQIKALTKQVEALAMNQKNTQQNRNRPGPRQMGSDMSSVVCFNCNNKGHYARQCYLPQQRNRGRGRGRGRGYQRPNFNRYQPTGYRTRFPRRENMQCEYDYEESGN